MDNARGLVTPRALWKTHDSDRARCRSSLGQRRQPLMAGRGGDHLRDSGVDLQPAPCRGTDSRFPRPKAGPLASTRSGHAPDFRWGAAFSSGLSAPAAVCAAKGVHALTKLPRCRSLAPSTEDTRNVTIHLPECVS